jgi:DNA-binding SARP family transcriptional activator
MRNQAAHIVGRIYLLGPLTVLDIIGRDCTPQGQKTKALVALLALGPRGSRSRAWLRDKLWSDRGEQQASGSLRQALAEVRKALSPLGANIVVSDNYTIALDLSRIWVDVHNLAGPWPFGRDAHRQTGTIPDFLEGLDVRDPEFEEWLSTERRHWDAKIAAIPDAFGDASVSSTARPTAADETQANTGVPQLLHPRLGIGLLPTIYQGTSELLASLADLMLEAIAANLQELLPLDIYDYRDSAPAHFGIAVGRGPDLLLRLRVQQSGDDVRVTLLAYRTASQKLIWSHSVHADQSDLLRLDRLTVSGFISHNVDRLAHAVFAGGHDRVGPEQSTAKTGYAALNLIFRVDSTSLSVAEDLLVDACRRDPHSLFLGLLAYISSFRVGEHLGEFDDAQRLATLAHATEALKIDPFNSVTLACIGHVYGYVMRDFETAGEIIRQAIEINPHQAFAWDHYALFSIYTGDYQSALQASRNAVRLGSFSPLRYSFETTLCMAATMLGDYQAAIYYGNRALARQPRFSAAMRYLVACYGHTGQSDDARALLERLYSVDPEFGRERVRQNSMAILDEAGRQRLLHGFILAGVRE